MKAVSWKGIKKETAKDWWKVAEALFLSRNEQEPMNRAFSRVIN